jgi:hypothetical protein
MKLRAFALAAALISCGLVLSGCSATQVSSFNATAAADAKAACPGLVAATPVVNVGIDAVGVAAGQGAVVRLGTTVGEGVVDADCAALTAAPVTTPAAAAPPVVPAS